MPNRDGSLRERALLGAQAHRTRTRDPAHGAAVRQTVPEDQQERPQRRGGYLRGGSTAQHALRARYCKSAKQQALLALRCARSGGVKARTAQANQIRGVLSEFGIVLPQVITRLRTRVLSNYWVDADHTASRQ